MHRAIQELKKITGKADTETEEKKKNNKNRTKYDEVEFKEKGGKYCMFHKGQELAMYIGNKPFQEAKRGFERPRLPKWKMEKAIYTAKKAQTPRLPATSIWKMLGSR